MHKTHSIVDRPIIQSQSAIALFQRQFIPVIYLFDPQFRRNASQIGGCIFICALLVFVRNGECPRRSLVESSARKTAIAYGHDNDRSSCRLGSYATRCCWRTRWENCNKYDSKTVQLFQIMIYSCTCICPPTDTPLFGFSHSHDVKAGTGDALDTISGRKKRELSSDTSTPWKLGLHLVISKFRASTNPIDRQKRQTNEFPSQVDPMGESSSNANGNSSNMSKIKNFFNKFVDAFDEMMVKVERIFRSAETDGTIATRAD